jgi:glucosamine--fructose-6-phosphate aminotransferase (isomerizing)
MNDWRQEAIDWRLGETRHVVFLGRGYSVSSACESALLMQELARRTATWYNAAEFRQGPVEALRSDHAVVVFAPAGATRDFSTRLAADLRHTGARIIVAGESFDAPEWLAPALQIIPVQMAAYAIAADAPGTLPGQFRYAAAISDKEDGLAVG